MKNTQPTFAVFSPLLIKNIILISRLTTIWTFSIDLVKGLINKKPIKNSTSFNSKINTSLTKSTRNKIESCPDPTPSIKFISMKKESDNNKKSTMKTAKWPTGSKGKTHTSSTKTSFLSILNPLPLQKPLPTREWLMWSSLNPESRWENCQNSSSVHWNKIPSQSDDLWFLFFWLAFD